MLAAGGLVLFGISEMVVSVVTLLMATFKIFLWKKNRVIENYVVVVKLR